jgi:phage-related protein
VVEGPAFGRPEGHRRIARIVFCVEQESMVLLHGFMKKGQKTPQRDINLALERKKGTRK